MAKCKDDPTRTPHSAFQAAVAVSLGLCGIPFRAIKVKKQAKGMLRSLLGPIARARDEAKAPGEKGAKKWQINGIFPGITAGVRNGILIQPVLGTSLA